MLFLLAVACFCSQHGEIIESSYLLNENNKEPKSTWTHILEALVLVATIGGGAYVLLFLFQNGNRHPTKQEPSGKPHAPVGATSASSMTSDDAECVNNPACLALGECERHATCCWFGVEARFDIYLFIFFNPPADEVKINLILLR